VQQLGRHVAGVLAALIELLAAGVVTAIALAVAIGGHWDNFIGVAAAVGPVLLLSAAAAWLLRFAARHLVRTWARAWGWKVVR
jgi:hypothetical protein